LPSEQLQLDAILSDRAEEIAALDRRLGLVDETKLTRPLVPSDRKVELVTKASVDLLLELDELVHAHRDDRVTIENWQGQQANEVLGNVNHAFPGPRRLGRRNERTDVDSLPLAQLWLDWWGDRDGLDAVRAAAVTTTLWDRADRLEPARK